MSRKKMVISALPPLAPETIIDKETGEYIDADSFSESLSNLVGFVQTQAIQLWESHKETLQGRLETIKTKQPADVGRQAGLKMESSLLPREIKAKSRIERLIRYNVITSARSYFASPVKTKQEPSFSSYINLGAVDGQMATLEVKDNIIELSLKCWRGEYLVLFRIPDYVMTRNVSKLTLPVIKLTDIGWVFVFNAEEIPSETNLNPRYVAGIDLGRSEPFTLSIVDVNTQRAVAFFTASNRIHILTAKLQRIKIELGHISQKIRSYNSLGLRTDTLTREQSLTRIKRNRLVKQITWLIAKEVETHTLKYNPRYVSMEDLSWVSDKHGMSRWSHSMDQAAITHKLSRRSIPVKKVSPRNTSQECCICGERINHIAGKRLVRCESCSLTFDRDVNASVNIAGRPLRKRGLGNNCSSQGQVITGVACSFNGTLLNSS